MSVTKLRDAVAVDAAAIAAIYDHHVRFGTASFDLEGPDALQWAGKIETISGRGWPFLVAEMDQKLVGYAYATQFRDRPAYARACEDSIYVAPGHGGQGVGTALLGALKAASAAAGFDQMIAVIGGAEPASVALHRKLGFEERGRLLEVGFKFGRRLDSLYMQVSLP